MVFVDEMTAADVERWLEAQHRNVAALRWFGDAAQDMGLTGPVDPATALRVLCYGVGPHGERLATIVAGTRERADGETYRDQPPVAYRVEFRPHETVRDLAVDPQAREAVLESHRLAVEAALEVLEATTQLWLVGVEATSHHELKSEVVFAASGRYWLLGTSWRPLGTVRDVIHTVLPAARAGLETYEGRLGKEIARRIKVDHL